MRLFLCFLVAVAIAAPVTVTGQPKGVESLLGQMRRFLPKAVQPHHTQGLTQLVSNVQREEAKPLIPVLVVSALGGSQLQAKLQNAKTSHYYCLNNADWYSLWFNQQNLYPLVINCFIENIKLKFEGGIYSPLRPGVSTRAPYWGSIKSCEWLDDAQKMPAWNAMANILRKVGYKDGYNMRAAPYDWRFGPDGLQTWFADVKNLIEEMYNANNKTHVAVVTYSLGSPYFALFCATVSQQWKDTYVRSFTSLSGAFGGSMWATATLSLPLTQYGAYGDQVKAIAMTFGSIPFLMPAQSIYKDKVFVKTASKNYTAADFSQLLADNNGSAALLDTYRRVKPYQDLPAPGVRLNCVYGVGVPTISTVTQRTPGSKLEVYNEDGDGGILLEGLEICKRWATVQKPSVASHPLFNMTHDEGVTDPRSLSVFLREIELV